MYSKSDVINLSNERHKTLIAKIVAMVVLLFATIICGALPFMLNRCFKWTDQKAKSSSSILINFMLQMSGGVLFATTFLHLLPEVYEVVEHLNMCDELPKLPFALPETLMCCGFFFIYFIESLIGLCMKNRMKKAGKLKKLSLEKLSKTVMTIEEASNNENDCDCDSGIEKKHSANLNTPTSLRGLLIVLALSLHEIFEGMAIGLEKRSSSVWVMFAAVAAHKLILAFCLGIEIIVAQTPHLLAALYVLLFAIITPIGIGIGILLSHNGVVTTSSLTAAILQGFACGTLLYVVFFEILKSHQAKLSSLLAIFIGFAVMFGLQMLDDDGDDQNNCQR